MKFIKLRFKMIIWICWSIAGVLLIAFLTFAVIPRVMMRTHAATLPVRDRAIERNVSKRFIVYEPAPSLRKYIKRYIIGNDESGPYFIGEWGRKIAFIRYNLTVFDAENKIIGIFGVEEKFNGGKTTHATRLPNGTDFVTVAVVCVDDTPFLAERRRFNVDFALWLAVLCLCLVLTVDILMTVGVAFALRCLAHFKGTLALGAGKWAALLGYTALGVVLVTVTYALLDFFLLRRRAQS